MLKIACLTLIIFYAAGNLVGQNDFNNHQKYWYLRAKLRNDFMKVGPNQGESTPFVERGYTSKVLPDNPLARICNPCLLQNFNIGISNFTVF